MEKIRDESTNPIDGKQIVSHFYYLTREERNHFTEILKDHDRAKTEKFIGRIQMDMEFSRKILDDEWKSGSHADQVVKLNDAVKTLRAASKCLLRIRSSRLKVLPPRQCNFLVEWMKNSRDPHSHSTVILETSRDAGIARQPIERLIENLKLAIKIEKVDRGRPRADELDLAFQIAKRFKEFIGTPCPNSGPFTHIVEYCFEIVGIKGCDRTRAIRYALRKLSQSQPSKMILQKSS
jgi:hypothetical protein